MSRIHTIDFDLDHDYTLIGIHSILEDYHLAYFLNQHLKLHLSRYKDDLDFKSGNCKFPLYTYEEESTFTSWSLISNKHNFLNEVIVDDRNIFGQETRTSFLIPEKKRVDFFVKIDGLNEDEKLNSTLQKINRIHKVITSYTIDPMELKSRDNLIF